MAAARMDYWEGDSPGPLTGVRDEERLASVQLAIDMSNDVNAVTDFGDLPLDEDPVTLFSRYPAVHEPWPHGDLRWNGATALDGAASTGMNAIVELLVANGARIDAKTRLGWSPLMFAEGIFLANTYKTRDSTSALIR